MNTVATQADPKKVEKFIEQLMVDLNRSALGLMISIGHRTGLFDAMSRMESVTSESLAQEAGTSERYTREWLGAMTTGGIVVYNPMSKTYRLPEEHAAALTRGSNPNMASTFQWISILGSVETEIVECFKKGGGVPYERFARFHEVMADESHQTVVAALQEHILPLHPAILKKLEQGVDVLDAGCGSGFALIEMAKLFPKSRFVGVDLCEDAAERGRARIRERGLKNITLQTRDFAKATEEAKYDLIFTFDAIHDQAAPDRVLKNLHRALKPGGIYLMQDIAGSSHVQNNLDHPLGTFIYTISCMHCMSVSLSQKGKGLGAMWGKETALQMLKEAGFKKTEVKTLPHDPINYYYVTQK